MMKVMKWLEKFFKRETLPKVDLPPNWLEEPEASAAPPIRRVVRKVATAPKPKGGVINLAEPPAAPRTNRSRGKINTPVPAKRGSKTLNLAGKRDAFNRRSGSVIDMRNKPKG